VVWVNVAAVRDGLLMKFLKIASVLFVSVVFLTCSRPPEREVGHTASMQIKGSDTGKENTTYLFLYVTRPAR